MFFNKHLLKLQFQLDHMPLLNRVLIASGLFFVVVMLWLFLAYFPLSHQITEAQAQAKKLRTQHELLSYRNESILVHVETHDMDALIDKYKQMQSEKKALEEAITTYRYRYVSDKAIAKLLHAVLEDMNDLSVEYFSTVIREEDNMTHAATEEDKKSLEKKAVTPNKTVEKTKKTAPKTPMLSPEITRYSLSLKGDYFSIMEFLKRVEALKWELFWDDFSYRVDKYPEGLATIEFYTLKTRKKASSVVQGQVK